MFRRKNGNGFHPFCPRLLLLKLPSIEKLHPSLKKWTILKKKKRKVRKCALSLSLSLSLRAVFDVSARLARLTSPQAAQLSVILFIRSLFMRARAIRRRCRRRRRCDDGKRDKNFVAFSFANILLFISGEYATANCSPRYKCRAQCYVPNSWPYYARRDIKTLDDKSRKYANICPSATCPLYIPFPAPQEQPVNADEPAIYIVKCFRDTRCARDPRSFMPTYSAHEIYGYNKKLCVL